MISTRWIFTCLCVPATPCSPFRCSTRRGATRRGRPTSGRSVARATLGENEGEGDDVSSRRTTPLLFLDPTLTERRTEELFAWTSAGIKRDDRRYEEGGPDAAMAAIFGRTVLDECSAGDEMKYDNIVDDDFLAWTAYIRGLKEEAHRRYKEDCEREEKDFRIGPILSQEERERNTLGPLGAGQWSGQYPEKFAHSLLVIGDDRGMQTVEDWISGLPRTCRQTMRKADRDTNCTVRTMVIDDDSPAPHSTLSHFRCVLQHQVRLARAASREDDGDYSREFSRAVVEGVTRFLMSTNECGAIIEFRDSSDVLGFCHVVGKGKTLRGQWFYASDDGARRHLWFRAVKFMVGRALEEDGATVVDLGPNGSDGRLQSHADLKARYGFELCDDWPVVADYRGPFWSIA